jgi:decaprenylphospho-beta-D-erythro-pentofuranosid-2-ulose 2-reductase
MSYILVIGAKSDIAKEISFEYAKNGFDLYLAARNVKELEEFADDIKVRFQRKIELIELDILQNSSHKKIYENLHQKPYGVISAVGYLGDQEFGQKDNEELNLILNTNFNALINFLNIVANDLEIRKEGFIVAISSVAGERGRRSNYLYGSAKAALTSYLSGLRNRLFDSGVHVMTVKPGFVDTKMTEKLDLPKKLTAQPRDVALSIYSGQQKCKDVIYTPRIWKFIMLMIRSIPELIFKRMKL